MNNLAVTYSAQNKFDKAEELQVKVMEQYTTKYGLNHPDTILSMDNLGFTYLRDQGRLKEAEELQVKVVELSKVMFGVNHPDTLKSMQNLATTYREQGRLDEAEKLQGYVAEERMAKFGEKHPDTLKSMKDGMGEHHPIALEYNKHLNELQVQLKSN